MLKEIRKIESRSQQMRIRILQYEGKLKRYFSEQGIVCYDEDELNAYKTRTHRGRPPKRD